MKTAFILFFIGILLSTAGTSQSSTDILLTENNSISLSGQVSESSIAKASQELGALSAKLPIGSVIYLVIDSPGGSVMAGNQFIDFANSLPQKVNPICLFCASMGYHIFESLGDRIVYSSSSLMSHRVSVGGIGGQIPGEAVTRIQSILNISNQMDTKVAKRIGVNVKEYQASIVNELWLTGEEAVKLKHADRIAKIRCDAKLLAGVKQDKVETMFGVVDVTVSKCPLISGPLSVDFNKQMFRSATEAIEQYKKVKRTIYRGF